MSKGLNIEFGSSKHGQGKTFCIWLLTYGTESKRPRTKLFSFDHAWNSKHKVWKLKAWPMQTFWLLASYFQIQK